MNEGAAPAAVKLWDLPVRLMHWSFVLLVPALWWTGEEGDLDTHVTIGLVMLGLVVFRLIWGFAGSSTARFARFVRGPGAVLRYLRGQDGAPSVGHNPLGALSVVALLAVLAVQTGLGLFAQDVDGLESGPLSYLVSYDTADAAREAHHLGFNVLLALIGLHLAAILYYLLFKRDNLIAPMVTGKRRFAGAVESPDIAPLWRALVAAAISAAFTWWLSLGAPLPGAA